MTLEMNIITFNKILISSIKHLDNLANLIDNTPRWRQFTQHYKIPKSFPCQISSDGYICMPLPYFAYGQLTIDYNEITFEPKPQKLYSFFTGMKFLNLHSEFNFRLNKVDISFIDKYKYPRPTSKIYKINMEWIHIFNNKNVLSGDFLLYASGYRYKSKTDKVYQILLDFKQGTLSLKN